MVLESIKEAISSIFFQENQDKQQGIQLNKGFLEAIAKLVVSFYFVLDALEKTLNNSTTHWIVSYKLHGMDTTLVNAGLISESL